MSTLMAVVLGTGFLLVIWLIVLFNGLVSARNRVQNGWAGIDVQLKRRHDLVPNPAETAKGYMQHERSVLEDVTRSRAEAASSGSDIPARAVAEASLTGALSRFFCSRKTIPHCARSKA